MRKKLILKSSYLPSGPEWNSQLLQQQMAGLTPLEQKMSDTLDNMKSFIDRRGKQVDSLQAQVDQIDLRGQGGRSGIEPSSFSLENELKQNEAFQRLLHDRKGRATLRLEGEKARQVFEQKTTLTSGTLGSATSGVISIERDPGIVADARRELTMRDVLAERPTENQLIDFVRVTTPMSIASPAPETTLKAENQLGFGTASARVKTIATWIPASKQILDDVKELMGFINTNLKYAVNLATELQILSGDGTGENLNGLITQASAFNAGLLTGNGGYNYMDVIGRAIQQITIANERQSTFIVMHPSDWWTIRLLKDGFGRYILGDPQTMVLPSLFAKPVVATVSMAQGHFLVGCGTADCVEVRDRMETTVDVSTEHADFFTKNLIAIRAECRLALVVKRPSSFVYGSLSSSPA